MRPLDPAPAHSPRDAVVRGLRRAATWAVLLGASFAATAQTPAAPAPAPGATVPRPKVCLVLSGGGARGAAHVGVLQVLEELRVPIDCVVGTSMGSIVGGAYAAGLAPERIERYVLEADWDGLLSDRPPRAERSVYLKELERARVGGAEFGLRDGEVVLPQGVLVGHSLQLFLQRIVRTARTGDFDRLALPYRAVATDFETGGMVVLGSGDLANAMRASMSVPGAFAPVERDGRILVDGGLVRNLPVDVARSLGADVVVAVNLGTPLLPRDRLGTLVAAAEQTLNILTEQNVRTSLAELREADVLISPDLGTITAGDFARAAEAIPAGAAAAHRVADELRALALGEADYARWQAAHRRDAAPARYARLRVDTSGLRHATPGSVNALLVDEYGPEELGRGLAQLLGTDDFQRIEATEQDDVGGTTLVLRPLEKSWGPQYLHAGLAMSSDFAGDSDFTVSLDHRATWLTRRGLEWRNRVSIGQVNSIDSELRQPLDRGRRWFAALRGGFLQEERELFVQGDSVAGYRNRRAVAGLGVGRRLGNYGEFEVGVETGRVDAIRITGLDAVFPDIRRRTSAITAGFVADRLDDLDFPQSGHLLSVDARLSRSAAGGDERYDRAQFVAQQAFGGGPASLLLGVRHGTSFGSSLPFYDPFTAGGFLDLSGYERDEILAERFTVASAVWRQRIGGGSGLLPGLYVGASVEHAEVGRSLNGFPDDSVTGGSVFLSAQSVLGPFYLGAGYGEGGRTSLYLYVGRP